MRGRPLLPVPGPPDPMRPRPGRVGRLLKGLDVGSLSLLFSLSLSGVKFNRITPDSSPSFTGFPFLVARLRCIRRADKRALQGMLPDLRWNDALPSTIAVFFPTGPDSPPRSIHGRDHRPGATVPVPRTDRLHHEQIRSTQPDSSGAGSPELPVRGPPSSRHARPLPSGVGLPDTRHSRPGRTEGG